MTWAEEGGRSPRKITASGSRTFAGETERGLRGKREKQQNREEVQPEQKEDKEEEEEITRRKGRRRKWIRIYRKKMQRQHNVH